MFKKILGALDSALQAFSSEASLIRQGLGGLDHIDKDIAARAVAFVASGADPEVLVELRAKAGDAGRLLGNPGRLKWSFPGNQKDSEADRAAAGSMAGRHALYQRVEHGSANIALLARLGKVLEAADQGRQIDHTGASMPEWLQYLLNDALWASFPDTDGARKQEGRPAWDVTLLAAILQHEELPGAMTLPIVFERRALDSYYHEQTYKRLLAPGALDDYMLARPAEVDATAACLSVAGRLLLCARIGGSNALLGPFTPLMVKFAVGDSKTVRAAAARHIDGMERGRCVAILSELLRTGQTEERANAADLLARTQGNAVAPVLEDALGRESSKPVQQAIRNALSRLQATDDAGSLELPAPPPLPELREVQLDAGAIELLLSNRAELLERLRKGADDEAQENLTAKHKYHFRRDHYERYRLLTEDELRVALLALNGNDDKRAVALLGNNNVEETLGFGNRLEARADFGLLQLLRWHAGAVRNGWGIWFHPRFQRWLGKQDVEQVDLRQLAALATQCGAAGDDFPLACLRSNWLAMPQPQAVLPAHRVCPYFAAAPELIDEGLGLAASTREAYATLDLGSTLAVLATFPVVPARWLPRVMEFALGEGKTHRAAAQQVLAGLPDIGKLVCDALASSKQELRIEAARWLTKLDYRAGVPALYAALQKETRETASAALMTALEQLGEDMSAQLAPARLLAQAHKGLKAKAPAGLAWLPLDALPACRWQDGAAVDPDIIRWWVILACKLKEPGGNALLERYLGLLDQPSRAALGASLLHQFIARDTAHPPHEEGIAWAQAHAAQRHQQYQDWAQRHPAYYEAQGKLTLEQVFEELRREKMAEYRGTAINEKGILALASGTPGHEMVGALQQYMRDHYQRRAQVEALLEAACMSNDAGVIQFALGIARRYRTASVQEKARLLVERIAERNGWTQDQLADRTIPTGGLDERGRLAMQYGSREYTVVLDAAMKPVLQNAEGKTVGALPAPRQDDPAESIKEAKQQFATCKKEVKQVVEMQAARLYEAMCAGRTWPAAEWREYLQQHPVVGRLAQRLVWLEWTADGAAGRLFRPADDGSLLDTADDDIALAPDASVRLAHATMMTAAQAKDWLAHFKDYKLGALFAQMTRPLPPPAVRDTESIADRLGWTSDTFTLRGAFGKLGYQRGQGEDGGVFFEYQKSFPSAGIRACIEFSGNALPEENLPAALKSLAFYSLGAARYSPAPVPLERVPPVLLAEAYGDYHAVAAACAGFDAEWEKKMPW
jgi:hypothetical protein